MDTADFRAVVRRWLADNVPPPPAPGADARTLVATAKSFQAALFDAGLAGLTWPRAYGGQGLTGAEQQVFQEEAARYELPIGLFMISMGMCGPTIVDLGTEEQKRRYLPRLLRGEEVWCQLFSEPGAGSDVAGLQTRAVRAEDGSGEWIVDGQKVWTSGAQHSDFGCLVARTDPDVPKHQGLTMFIVDLHAPGVTVRPLRDMSGRAPFNEVYLDGVRLPADAVLGGDEQIGRGWPAAVLMLGHERVSIGSAARSRDEPLGRGRLAALAQELGRHRDPEVRRRLAALYAGGRGLSLFTARLRQEADAGEAPGARGSVGKLAGAELLWQAVEAASVIAGPRLTAWDPEEPGAEAMAELVTSINSVPASSIAGGTNQIQRNIIGERILGLPKDPAADRDVPFRRLRVGTQRQDDQQQDTRKQDNGKQDIGKREG
ncbi:acyl-CoA dehydrogenase family protein [Phaeacidiphilus oryzae]|uniref:acyl-CoA dehydrogenase family protein n=1 Tax=Phaeacidiphilus oryzae TaxID=348818 RepID=UPI0007C874F5|nr:acyl-CoA dehydrogenase family protein [Phaeacidiphilus oryzae]